MIGLFNEQFLSSSYIALGLMDYFDAYAGVVGLLRKGREIPVSGRQPAALILISNAVSARVRLECCDPSGVAWISSNEVVSVKGFRSLRRGDQQAITQRTTD